jgi:5-(carboxyamino)imidazole ribonucleotide mutase
MSMNPKIGVVMGSQTDWMTMRRTIDTLKLFPVSFEVKIMSAHRTPERVANYAKEASQGIRVIIAGAGGAAHLAGVLASYCLLPVLAVPVPGGLLGIDSLLSTVQMPKGIPAGVMGIGESGAVNAALLAVSILAVEDSKLWSHLQSYRKKLSESVPLEPNHEVGESV